MQPTTVLQPGSSGTGEPHQEPASSSQEGKELTPGQLSYKQMLVTNPELALWGGDPNCDHEEKSQPGGGVKCIYCPAWFCF